MTFLKKIKEFEKKYPDQNNVPRPQTLVRVGGLITIKKLNFGLDGRRVEFMKD